MGKYVKEVENHGKRGGDSMRYCKSCQKLIIGECRRGIGFAYHISCYIRIFGKDWFT